MGFPRTLFLAVAENLPLYRQPRFNDVSLTKNGQNRGANATEFDDLATSDFLRSLTSLQVLDNLAAQADRHGQNFFADITVEGKLGKVQGIDNDFSFSDITMDWDDSVGQMGSPLCLNARRRRSCPLPSSTRFRRAKKTGDSRRKNSFFRSMIPAVAVRPSGPAQIAADYLSFRQAVLTVHGENDTIRDAESH